MASEEDGGGGCGGHKIRTSSDGGWGWDGLEAVGVANDAIAGVSRKAAAGQDAQHGLRRSRAHELGCRFHESLLMHFSRYAFRHANQCGR